jgi:hypothetical protein
VSHGRKRYLRLAVPPRRIWMQLPMNPPMKKSGSDRSSSMQPLPNGYF